MSLVRPDYGNFIERSCARFHKRPTSGSDGAVYDVGPAARLSETVLNEAHGTFFFRTV
jgi:hypothetical protein